MATVNKIFVDHANNIVTKTRNILKEKDAEKKQIMLEQIKFLKHEADICLSEIMFVDRIAAEDDRITTLQKRLGRCIKFAESACKGGDIEDLMDEDFMEAYFNGVQKSICAFRYEAYNSDTRMWMLDPNTSFGEPNSATKEEDLVRIDHATDPICKIVSAIADKKKHPVNVLMSRGNYEPSAITKMKADLGDNVRIYGMYDKQTLIQNMDMRLQMEKCCFGDSKDYNIRNKVFDIAFQRFGGSRDYDQEYVSTAASAESPVTKDIGRFWRYLAPGGILLYLMPSFLLRNKERKSIASKFQYLWSLQVHDKAFNLNMELAALRKSENHDSDKEYEAVTNRVPAEALDDEMIDQAVEDVPLEDLGEVNLFNGPEDDLLIIQIALNSSTLKLKDDDERHRSIDPLLPLKKGQIGQIIASGRLNGVIDEGNGFKHVISGRVVRNTVHEKTVDYSDPNNAVEEEVTKDCNQIEIMAIGGDGDIRQLTVAA